MEIEQCIRQLHELSVASIRDLCAADPRTSTQRNAQLVLDTYTALHTLRVRELTAYTLVARVEFIATAERIDAEALLGAREAEKLRTCVHECIDALNGGWLAQQWSVIPQMVDVASFMLGESDEQKEVTEEALRDPLCVAREMSEGMLELLVVADLLVRARNAVLLCADAIKDVLVCVRDMQKDAQALDARAVMHNVLSFASPDSEGVLVALEDMDARLRRAETALFSRPLNEDYTMSRTDDPLQTLRNVARSSQRKIKFGAPVTAVTPLPILILQTMHATSSIRLSSGSSVLRNSLAALIAWYAFTNETSVLTAEVTSLLAAMVAFFAKDKKGESTRFANSVATFGPALSVAAPTAASLAAYSASILWPETSAFHATLAEYMPYLQTATVLSNAVRGDSAGASMAAFAALYPYLPSVPAELLPVTTNAMTYAVLAGTLSVIAAQQVYNLWPEERRKHPLRYLKALLFPVSRATANAQITPALMHKIADQNLARVGAMERLQLLVAVGGATAVCMHYFYLSYGYDATYADWGTLVTTLGATGALSYVLQAGRAFRVNGLEGLSQTVAFPSISTSAVLALQSGGRIAVTLWKEFLAQETATGNTYDALSIALCAVVSRVAYVLGVDSLCRSFGSDSLSKGIVDEKLIGEMYGLQHTQYAGKDVFFNRKSFDEVLVLLTSFLLSASDHIRKIGRNDLAKTGYDELQKMFSLKELSALQEHVAYVLPKDVLSSLPAMENYTKRMLFQKYAHLFFWSLMPMVSGDATQAETFAVTHFGYTSHKTVIVTGYAIDQVAQLCTEKSTKLRNSFLNSENEQTSSAREDGACAVLHYAADASSKATEWRKLAMQTHLILTAGRTGAFVQMHSVHALTSEAQKRRFDDIHAVAIAGKLHVRMDHTTHTLSITCGTIGHAPVVCAPALMLLDKNPDLALGDCVCWG